MNPYVLLILGLLLVLLEFYLPGAIMGTIGGILLLLSIILFASNSESPWAIMLFTVFTFVGLGAVIKFALWQIRGTGSRNTIYLNSDQEGYQASSYDVALIGKEGVALSDLKPSGFILIEGRQYQAVAQTGYIVKGSLIQVLSGQGAYYVVKFMMKKD